MTDIKPLNLEFDIFFIKDKPEFLIGTIALAKKFKRKLFSNNEAKSYLLELHKKGIPVYGAYQNCPAESYYRKGLLAKMKEGYPNKSGWIIKYGVIKERMSIVKEELKKPDYSPYLKFLTQI